MQFDGHALRVGFDRAVLVIALVFLCALMAQTAGTVNVIGPSPTTTVIATAGPLVCNITAPAAKTSVTLTCSNGATALPVTTLDVSQSTEAVTYGLNLGGHAITGLFTQAATVGTLAFSVTADGSTAKTGNF